MAVPRVLLIAIALVTLFWGTEAQKTFRNPILDTQAADLPAIIKYQDYYYLSYTQGNRVEILKSPILSNFRNAERKIIYQLPPSQHSMWAPEFQSINGDLYIYFTIRFTADNHNNRLHVIKCLDPSSDPMGQWSNETRILPEDDFGQKEGTVMQYDNGQLYFIWSAYPEAVDIGRDNIYIARMENPMKVLTSTKTLLKAPFKEWEIRGRSSVRAPVILQRDGRTLLVYSGSRLLSPDYCLGIMGIDGGSDPMIPDNWFDDLDECIFARNDEEQVWAPGQATFVQSPDDTETWLVYEARNHNREEGANRTVRIDKIQWEMNTPIFPNASGTDRDLEVPSGE